MWKVEEVKTDEVGDCLGEDTQVKILINITKPLKNIIELKQEGEEDIPMAIFYERLSNFCFYYGLIGHNLGNIQNTKANLKKRLHLRNG